MSKMNAWRKKKSPSSYFVVEYGSWTIQSWRFTGQLCILTSFSAISSSMGQYNKMSPAPSGRPRQINSMQFIQKRSTKGCSWELNKEGWAASYNFTTGDLSKLNLRCIVCVHTQSNSTCKYEASYHVLFCRPPPGSSDSCENILEDTNNRWLKDTLLVFAFSRH